MSDPKDPDDQPEPERPKERPDSTEWEKKSRPDDDVEYR